MRIQIEADIGRGSSGCVKLARDIDTLKPLAAKVIDLDSSSGRRQFKLEASIMSQLPAHKNLPKLYGIGKEKQGNKKVGYIVLEYLPFPTLKEYLRKNGPLPVADSLNILRQLVRVVRKLAQNGVAHRDIKPENIMINPDNLTIKLIDFGLGQFISGFDAADRSYRGTPIYMPPEILLKKKYSILKAEAWSIGVTFYEMLTGVQPFADCPTVDSILRAQAFGLDFFKFPPAVERILRRFLALDPQQRVDIERFRVSAELAEFDALSPRTSPLTPRERRLSWSSSRTVTFENIQVFRNLHEKARTGEKEEGLLARLVKNAREDEMDCIIS